MKKKQHNTYKNWRLQCMNLCIQAHMKYQMSAFQVTIQEIQPVDPSHMTERSDFVH